MASVIRVKAQWSGFQGAPGYNILHFSSFANTGFVPADSQSAADRARTFYNSIAATLPAQVTVQVMPDVDVIDTNSGDLQEVHGITAPALVTGTAGSTVPYASPVGAVVSWSTSQVRNGRRIRGRTFLVPLTSNAFETNGTIQVNSLNIITTAAATLRAAPGTATLGVYARPSSSTATDGEWAPVSASRVPDMAAVLRSRRD